MFFTTLLWHTPQSFGTVKTVPYSAFYYVLQAHKIFVGRCARRRVSEANRRQAALRPEMDALIPPPGEHEEFVTDLKISVGNILDRSGALGEMLL